MWTISEVAEKARVTRRTVRYYVELGILPPPEGQGRAALYGPEHLERLRFIGKLQANRLTLDEIRDYFASESRGAQPDEPSNPPLMTSGVAEPEWAIGLQESAIGEPESAQLYVERLRRQMGAPEPKPPSKPMDHYVADPWMRIPLAEDVELHVRQRRNRTDRRIIRLIREAQRILSEEGSS